MEEKIREMENRFGGRLIATKRVKRLICSTLLIFPEKIINLVTKQVWFVSSFDDAWGFTIKGEEIRDKYLVFLSDELFEQDTAQQRYTIAHEVGHVVLKHRNAILEHQTQAEIDRQERQAHEFARSYLDN